MKVAVLAVMMVLLGTSHGASYQRCPLIGCTTNSFNNNPTDPKCLEDAETLTKCVGDAMDSDDICNCEATMVSSYAMLAGHAGGNCRDPTCDVQEVKKCMQSVSQGFMNQRKATEAADCMEQLSPDYIQCFAVVPGGVSGLSDDEKEEMVSVGIKTLRLMAGGCRFQESSMQCLSQNQFGPSTDPCSYGDALDTTLNCMKQKAAEAGDVCDGAGELIEAAFAFQKRVLFDNACTQHKRVQETLAQCGGRTERDLYRDNMHRQARGLWPFS